LLVEGATIAKLIADVVDQLATVVHQWNGGFDRHF
jgi:hypothetical protein